MAQKESPFGTGTPANPADGDFRRFNGARTIRPESWDDLKSIIESTNTAGEWDVLRMPVGYSLSGNGPSSSITLEPTDGAGGARRLLLDFPESALDITADGGGAPVFDVPANGGNDADIIIRLGTFTGSGTAPTSWEFLRGTDVTAIGLYYDAIADVYRGVHARNLSSYSEEWTVDGKVIIANDGAITFTRDGGDASMQGWRVDTRIDMYGPDRNATIGNTGIAMPQQAVGFAESQFRTKIFAHDGTDVGVEYNSVGGGHWHINVDGRGTADQGAVGVKVNGTSNAPTHFVLNTSFLGSEFEEGANPGFWHWRQAGFDAALYNGATKIATPRREWARPVRTSQPTTDDIPEGHSAMVVSDGSWGGVNAGDMVVVYNNAGTIEVNP